ncbi:hypothetical protein EJ02DRAFT_509664 [Clathrospora elynae]|uniref:Uncharacterized protein n=1 Tax=Clathrospora elynae TaxID=706981 RepID=A0A6A5SZR3_9PLEO|nr:hypothetical protein EJ02DRAFT_509664 [Clathrospora elynae]
MMATSMKPFRFLDLPRELRDKVYDYALCSFSYYAIPTSIGQYARVHAQSPIEKRWFLVATNLLFANLQIHNEAYSYMLRVNLFVRIECRGFENRNFMHGRAKPIRVLESSAMPDTERAKRVNRFPWYAMRLIISVDFKIKGKRKMRRKECKDIVMLWADLERVLQEIGNREGSEVAKRSRQGNQGIETRPPEHGSKTTILDAQAHAPLASEPSIISLPPNHGA